MPLPLPVLNPTTNAAVPHPSQRLYRAGLRCTSASALSSAVASTSHPHRNKPSSRPERIGLTNTDPPCRCHLSSLLLARHRIHNRLCRIHASRSHRLMVLLPIPLGSRLLEVTATYRPRRSASSQLLCNSADAVIHKHTSMTHFAATNLIFIQTSLAIFSHPSPDLKHPTLTYFCAKQPAAAIPHRTGPLHLRPYPPHRKLINRSDLLHHPNSSHRDTL